MTFSFVKNAGLVFKCARIVLWPAIFFNTVIASLFSTSASLYEASLVAMSLCCVASFGFLINDCKDTVVDRVNKSNRLENASANEIKSVWQASFGFLAVGFILSLPSGLNGFLSVLLVSLGLAIYTFYARERLLFATILAAALSSTPLWISCWAFSSSLPISKIGIIAFVILSLMGRELIFDVADAAGDSHGKRRTFATVFSRQIALNLAIALNLFGGILLCLLLLLNENAVSSLVAWSSFLLFCWLMYWPLLNLRNRLEPANGVEFFTSQSRLAMLLLPVFWIIF